ncbi:hypothetical protein GC176_17745 [bacterium]|nr:hypothetical protein [bacterium]
MPTRFETACFGNVNDEYTAALESAAIFDVSDRTRLEMTGPDAATFLHRFCTNELQSLPPGHGCEAFLCNVKGRILGHVFAFVGKSGVRIDTAPGQADSLIAHLEKYHLLEDFQLSDATAQTFAFLVSGNEAASRLDIALPCQSALPPLGWQAADGISIRRVDLLGVTGFLIDGPVDAADETWQRFTAAGITPAGRDALTALRIEAGFPEYGRDLSDDNLAQEANRTTEAISFTKGCYLGQEPIARLHAMGHVNRELVCVEIEPADGTASPDNIPAAGAEMLHPGKPDKEIGTLTSIAWTPGRGRAVGLAILRSQFAQPGSEVPLVSGGTARVIERRK